MNRIIVIGNGFDKAHGLATGYNDFIDSYWNDFGNRIYGEYQSWQERSYGAILKINKGFIYLIILSNISKRIYNYKSCLIKFSKSE